MAEIVDMDCACQDEDNTNQTKMVDFSGRFSLVPQIANLILPEATAHT
jgi:hypothetical protein